MDMNARGKSDDCVVPLNPVNNGGTEPPAESAEGRRSARRNIKESHLGRTSKPAHRRSRGLFGVRETAKRRRGLRFTNLLHHINVELLTSSLVISRMDSGWGCFSVVW